MCTSAHARSSSVARRGPDRCDTMCGPSSPSEPRPSPGSPSCMVGPTIGTRQASAATSRVVRVGPGALGTRRRRRLLTAVATDQPRQDRFNDARIGAAIAWTEHLRGVASSDVILPLPPRASECESSLLKYRFGVTFAAAPVEDLRRLPCWETLGQPQISAISLGFWAARPATITPAIETTSCISPAPFSPP